MPKRSYFMVEVVYPSCLYPEYDATLQEVAGVGACQSGCGFGQRDIGWEIFGSDDRERAIALAEKFERLSETMRVEFPNIPRMSVWVTRYGRRENDVEVIRDSDNA